MTLSQRSRAASSRLLALCLLFAPSTLAQAQPTQTPQPLANIPACTLEGKLYHCSKPNLEQALAAAHTLALVSQPANHASDAALAALAKSLDKTVVPAAGTRAPASAEATPADLTLRLTPIEPAGVTVGSGSVDLALLNIFIAAPGNPTARLLWSETYTGNPDMPWPSIARALILQFKQHLGVK